MIASTGQLPVFVDDTRKVGLLASSLRPGQREYAAVGRTAKGLQVGNIYRCGSSSIVDAPIGMRRQPGQPVLKLGPGIVPMHPR
jgi:hypothetical protein